jgi:hypothetical protein
MCRRASAPVPDTALIKIGPRWVSNPPHELLAAIGDGDFLSKSDAAAERAND